MFKQRKKPLRAYPSDWRGLITQYRNTLMNHYIIMGWRNRPKSLAVLNTKTILTTMVVTNYDSDVAVHIVAVDTLYIEDPAIDVLLKGVLAKDA